MATIYGHDVARDVAGGAGHEERGGDMKVKLTIPHKLILEFAPAARPIKDQLCDQGYAGTLNPKWQRYADMIMELKVQQIITQSEVVKAEKRILAKIKNWVERG